MSGIRFMCVLAGPGLSVFLLQIFLCLPSNFCPQKPTVGRSSPSRVFLLSRCTYCRHGLVLWAPGLVPAMFDALPWIFRSQIWKVSSKRVKSEYLSYVERPLSFLKVCQKEWELMWFFEPSTACPSPSLQFHFPKYYMRLPTKRNVAIICSRREMSHFSAQREEKISLRAYIS